MRALTLAIAVSLMGGAPATAVFADTSATALPVAVEACIRANAAKVEQAVPDLNQAVEFLVSDVCAVQVADENARKAKVVADKQAARMKTMCDALPKSGAKSSDEDEDSLAAACANRFEDEDWSTIYVTGFASQNANMPAATALASQLLLDLRLSHSKSGSSH